MKLYKDIIAQFIPDHSRVLDLGCGKGSLLQHLIHQKGVTGYGVDIEFSNIKACISQGIPAYQGNISEGMKEFSNNAYDVVILSQTLQEVQDPIFVLNEICRVGKQGIVTFPNFGYWRNRTQLLLSGRAPKNKTLPYDWYNTPNIRVITIQDFKQLCKKEAIQIKRQIPLFKWGFLQQYFPLCLSNLLSQKGIFLLEK